MGAGSEGHPWESFMHHRGRTILDASRGGKGLFFAKRDSTYIFGRVINGPEILDFHFL